LSDSVDAASETNLKLCCARSLKLVIQSLVAAKLHYKESCQLHLFSHGPSSCSLRQRTRPLRGIVVSSNRAKS
jgi:hypothetical protein